MVANREGKIGNLGLADANYSFFFVFLPFPGPLPVAYGSSQARGLIGAGHWPKPEPQQCGI